MDGLKFGNNNKQYMILQAPSRSWTPQKIIFSSEISTKQNEATRNLQQFGSLRGDTNLFFDSAIQLAPFVLDDNNLITHCTPSCALALVHCPRRSRLIFAQHKTPPIRRLISRRLAKRSVRSSILCRASKLVVYGRPDAPSPPIVE
jgi:hypothetical protein